MTTHVGDLHPLAVLQQEDREQQQHKRKSDSRDP
jgi:hypothetical protein